LLCASDVSALADGALTLFVEEIVTHNNNVLRFPSGVNFPAGAESSSRTDTYHTTAVGLTFDVPVSRQRFQGGFTWNDIRYDRYSSLDYTGHDARAIWLWQIEYGVCLRAWDDLPLADAIVAAGGAPAASEIQRRGHLPQADQGRLFRRCEVGLQRGGTARERAQGLAAVNLG
jgi:hypothetical protein